MDTSDEAIRSILRRLATAHADEKARLQREVRRRELETAPPRNPRKYATFEVRQTAPFRMALWEHIEKPAAEKRMRDGAGGRESFPTPPPQGKAYDRSAEAIGLEWAR